MVGYAHRIAAAYDRGTIDRRRAWTVIVAHDPDCRQRQGFGDCNCIPDITARDLQTGDVVQIGIDGAAIAEGRTS